MKDEGGDAPCPLALRSLSWALSPPHSLHIVQMVSGQATQAEGLNFLTLTLPSLPSYKTHTSLDLNEIHHIFVMESLQTSHTGFVAVKTFS